MSSNNNTKKQKGGKGGFHSVSKGKNTKTTSDPETDEEDTPEFQRLQSKLQTSKASLDAAMQLINTLKSAPEQEAKALLAQLRANQQSKAAK